MAVDYSVNYDDPRFGKVEAEEKQALAEDEQIYGGMIESSDKYYDDLKQTTQDWADKQTALQQEQTDFAIEKIEQQKNQLENDYKKEQSGAYVDWQKQSNQYGVNAEKIASAGLTNTGYSESSQVSMYNTYQNRVATARESYQRAVLDYDNAIKDAMLQNNATLAEIAYTALQQRLELSLQGFQYKNSLIAELSNQKKQTKQFYANQWQNVLNQINTENALAEEIRQFNIANSYKNTSSGYGGGLGDVSGVGITKSPSGDSSSKVTKSSNGVASNRQSGKIPSKSFSNYDKAVDYMKSKGVPGDAASGAMAHNEWVNRKGSYQYTGTGGAEVANYNTYTDYLTDYVSYCMQKYT